MITSYPHEARGLVYRHTIERLISSDSAFATIKSPPGTFRFEFSVSASGKSHVAIGTFWAPSVAIVTRPLYVELSCSGAHVKFTDVEITQADGKDP